MKLTSTIHITALAVASVTLAAPVPVVRDVVVETPSRDASINQDGSSTTLEARDEEDVKKALKVILGPHAELSDWEKQNLKFQASMLRGGANEEMLADLNAKGKMPTYPLNPRPLKPPAPLRIDTVNDPYIKNNHLRTPAIVRMTPIPPLRTPPPYVPNRPNWIREVSLTSPINQLKDVSSTSSSPIKLLSDDFLEGLKHFRPPL